MTPHKCARCSIDLSNTGFTMSRFTTEEICLACEEDEQLSPNYQKARDAEEAEVRKGLEVMRSGGNYKPHYNFPGIGLAPEDLAFLEERRRQRK